MRDGFSPTIGERSVIGNDCILDGRNGTQIGKDVNISSGVSIWTLQHDVNDSEFRYTQKKL